MGTNSLRVWLTEQRLAQAPNPVESIACVHRQRPVSGMLNEAWTIHCFHSSIHVVSENAKKNEATYLGLLAYFQRKNCKLTIIK